MRRILTWGGVLLGSLVGVLLILLAVVYIWSGIRMNRILDVEPQLPALSLLEGSLERGERIATIRGCVDCHGADLAGRVFIDDPLAGRLVAPNLTDGAGSVTADYVEGDWIRSIRHGVDPSGRRLRFMPSYEYYELGERDIVDLISYLESLDPIDNRLPTFRLGPALRISYLSGAYPVIAADVIPHHKRPPVAPRPGPTAEYGRYLAISCTGCHGPGFSGGKIPGTPPDFPPAANLTPDGPTGLGTWTEEDFRRLLRTGTRPDGRVLDNRYMPWTLSRAMTEEEMSALWAYLRSVPIRQYGNR